jgi:zinc transporter ZupT
MIDFTTLIIAVIGSFITLLGVMIGLFIYLAGKIDSLKLAVFNEMKDFHGRLCTLEERQK